MAINQAEFDAAMATYLAANEHTIALRRGLAADLPSGLLQAELYYGMDTKEIKVGHGDGSNVSVGLSAYPVGSVYISVGATSPATLFGGTWSAFGAGRTLVGIDGTQTEFDTVEETGGEKTHVLTEAEMPEHTHNLLTGSSAYPAGTSILADNIGNKTSGDYLNTGSAGSDDPHNNLQPYVVVRMWKRTA